MKVGLWRGLEVQVVMVRNLYNRPAVAGGQVVEITCRGLPVTFPVSALASRLPWDSPRQVVSFRVDKGWHRQAGPGSRWSTGAALLLLRLEMLQQVELVKSFGHRDILDDSCKVDILAFRQPGSIAGLRLNYGLLCSRNYFCFGV